MLTQSSDIHLTNDLKSVTECVHIYIYIYIYICIYMYIYHIYICVWGEVGGGGGLFKQTKYYQHKNLKCGYVGCYSCVIELTLIK